MNADDFLFLDSDHYSRVSSLKGTAVFRFTSPVYFATLSVFKQQLFANSISLSELKARQILVIEQKNVVVSVKIDGEKAVETDCDENGKVIDGESAKENMKLKNESGDLPVGENNGESALMPVPDDGTDGSNTKWDETSDIQNIIVDCNAVPFVDTAGSLLLAQLHGEYSKHGVRFVLAGCSDSAVRSLKRVEECQSLCNEALYPSVPSAVLCLHRDAF